MAKPTSTETFRVDLNGLKLSQEESAQLGAAVQSGTLAQLASFDTRGDFVAIAFPGGGTQGIRVLAEELLDERLPQLRETLRELEAE